MEEINSQFVAVKNIVSDMDVLFLFSSEEVILNSPLYANLVTASQALQTLVDSANAPSDGE